MNILHIISSPASGGAEVYVKDLAKYLAGQGHNLHIAFLSNASDIGRDSIYEENFLNDLKFSGIHIYIIGNETRKKPWLGMLRIKKYISDHNIDICHTHLAFGILFTTLSSVPVVYTHHSMEPRWGKFLYQVFNRLVDEYVGISNKCAKALESYTMRNINTIPNAVSEEKFIGYKRARVPNDVINIVMVGRLTVQKDYMNMLRALNVLDEKLRANLRVKIAGEGEINYKSQLLEYINKNNLNEVVAFVGVQTNIPEFLYKADIFLMSSAWEGLPIALTEATVSGLPCIVTDVGGCAEVIVNSGNGIVVAPQNPQDLAEAITSLVNQPNLIEQYSRNALHNSAQYSISKAAQLHLHLYSKMLK
ncbi:glycosyltransferase [Acinetobacter sp. AND/436]|uniref:glycosyltransferase n=1 Tax=Acinetobacter sp. AND/436 TaxID=3414736 RepID=UPI003C2D1EE5